MLKHTPGDWTVRSSYCFDQTYFITSLDEHGNYHSIGELRTANPDCKANAHLMSASPDLQEALELMCIWLRGCLNSKEFEWDADQKAAAKVSLENSQKALAKSRGETS